MLKLYKPKYEDLYFRKSLVEDKDTMSFNHAYGGIIPFPKSKWLSWYRRWFENDNRFYRYLKDDDKFVGEVAYYLEDDKYMLNIIVHSKYRNKGYGKRGLELLLSELEKQGIEVVYDEIAIDNPCISMFLKADFKEISRDEKTILIKREIKKTPSL